MQPNTEVELSVEGSKLVIEPVAKPVYDLNELLSKLDFVRK